MDEVMQPKKRRLQYSPTAMPADVKEWLIKESRTSGLTQLHIISLIFSDYITGKRTISRPATVTRDAKTI